MTSNGVRPVTSEDIPRIVELERRSFSDPWSAASFESALAHPRVYMVCQDAGDGAGLRGYLVAWFVADEGEIANLAVDPEARRSGIGGALIDSAIGEARRLGVRALYLEVRESNGAARQLYASRGFLEVGRRRGYYRLPVEDAIVLRREEVEAAG